MGKVKGGARAPLSPPPPPPPGIAHDIHEPCFPPNVVLTAKSGLGEDTAPIDYELLNELKTLIDDYRNSVAKLPLNDATKLEVEHKIDLSDDSPVVLPARCLPYSLINPIKKEIDMLLKNGFITHSNSAYNSPIEPIVKKNGTIKIAVDHRSLNSKTVTTPFPIPHPEDLFNQVKGAKYFSVLDLQNAYFHIPIKKSDTHKTAFVLPWNKCEWKVLCCGLVGAPFTFTEAMTFGSTIRGNLF